MCAVETTHLKRLREYFNNTPANPLARRSFGCTNDKVQLGLGRFDYPLDLPAHLACGQ